MFPFLDFESGFDEEDPLWKPDEKESFEHHVGRTEAFLEKVFSTDDALFVGLFGHHGNVRERVCCSLQIGSEFRLQSDTAFKLIGHEVRCFRMGCDGG